MWYKNVRAQNILILLISLTGLGSTFYFINLKPQLNTEEVHQIQSAVYSHVFNYISNYPEEDPEYFFISISDSDPSPRLLNDFINHIPKVAPVSSSEMSFGFSSTVSLKSDKSKKGVIVNLETGTKRQDGYVQVLVYLYKSRSNKASYEYILNKDEDAYRVTSFKGTALSEFMN